MYLLHIPVNEIQIPKACRNSRPKKIPSTVVESADQIGVRREKPGNERQDHW